MRRSLSILSWLFLLGMLACPARASYTPALPPLTYATPSLAGTVKPDGTTISVNGTGVVSETFPLVGIGAGLTNSSNVLSVTYPNPSPAAGEFPYANSGGTAYTTSNALIYNGTTLTDNVATNIVSSSSSTVPFTFTEASGQSAPDWQVKQNGGSVLGSYSAENSTLVTPCSGNNCFSIVDGGGSVLFKGFANYDGDETFFQLGQLKGFFTSSEGSAFSQFGITSNFTSISDYYIAFMPSPTGLLDLTTTSTTKPEIAVHLSSGQTADALDINNSSNTLLAKFNNVGIITTPSISQTVRAVTTGTTDSASATDHLITFNSSGSVAETLPAASTWTGQEMVLANLSSTHSVTVTNSIVGSIADTLATLGATERFTSDGTNIFKD